MSDLKYAMLPASFQFPRRVELWTPLGHKAAWTEQRGWHPGMYAAKVEPMEALRHE